jgi:hypothetical protein
VAGLHNVQQSSIFGVCFLKIVVRIRQIVCDEKPHPHHSSFNTPSSRQDGMSTLPCFCFSPPGCPAAQQPSGPTVSGCTGLGNTLWEKYLLRFHVNMDKFHPMWFYIFFVPLSLVF